jgi:hypothetical protein
MGGGDGGAHLRVGQRAEPAAVVPGEVEQVDSKCLDEQELEDLGHQQGVPERGSQKFALECLQDGLERSR